MVKYRLDPVQVRRFAAVALAASAAAGVAIGGALVAQAQQRPAPAQAQPLPPGGSPPLPPVSGVWIDDTGKGAIEIMPCGNNRLCGRIVWLKEPADTRGTPLTDGYNPDPRLRQRPICGLQVIGDLRPVGGSAWDDGWIYDPKQGKQFDVELKPRGPDRLQVTGYLGVKFLSETFTWTRAPANLVRCPGAEAVPGTQATTR